MLFLNCLLAHFKLTRSAVPLSYCCLELYAEDGNYWMRSISPGVGAVSGQQKCSVGVQCGESVEDDESVDARIYC